MKILVAIDTLAAGGAETFVMRLVSGLCDTHEVHLVHFHPKLQEYRLTNEFLSTKVKIVEYRRRFDSIFSGMDRILNKIGVDPFLMENRKAIFLRKLIKREKYELINSHLFNTDRIACKAAKNNSIPIDSRRLSQASPRS